MVCQLLCVAAIWLAEPQGLGRRMDIDGASLFVPTGFHPQGNTVDVLLHLHGATSVVEPAFVEAGWPGVLIVFNRPGLSSVYAQPFREPGLLPDLLDRAMKALRAEGFIQDPSIGRLVVSSFSAGFGGVREMLKVSQHADRIDAIVMADSLYCGYIGDPAKRQLDPRLMAPFRRFAAQAVAGNKALLLTHSAQVPEGYGSTTETSDDLICWTKAVPTTEGIDWGPNWLSTRRFVKGGFEVVGFAGPTGDDHLRHLREIARIWIEARRLIDPR
jgi:hypothetical protein